MTSSTSRLSTKINPATFFIIFLSGIYVLACFSPFRLSHDGIRYILMEEWMEDGFPANTKAARDFLPYGYSTLLFLLSKLHLLKAPIIAIVNTFYLFGTLYFVNRIFGMSILKKQLIIYVLLNWLAIKFVITSRSEIQYLFFSCGALFFYLEYCQRNRKRDLAGLLFFLVIATLTRTVAIVLVAAIFLDFLNRRRQELAKWSRIKIWLPLVLLLVVGSIYFLSASKSSAYFGYLMRPIQHQGFSTVLKGIISHFSDLGELFINAPASKLNSLNPSLRKYIYLVVGFAFFTVFLYVLRSKKFGVPFVVKWYILFYSAVIFCWPFFDSRFWLPLLPFFVGIFLQATLNSSFINKKWFFPYKWFYISAGIFALSYYVFTSFDRKALSINQDAGIWKKEYTEFFWGKSIGDTSTGARPEIVRLLKKLD